LLVGFRFGVVVGVGAEASNRPLFYPSHGNPQRCSCYFCLEEDAGNEGKPLVRDCSCRGDSGFAHFSCLTKYAEQTCRALEGIPFAQSWELCNNCKQQFQNQLSIDLATEFVSFTEATYSYGHAGNGKWGTIHVLDSLMLKVEALSRTEIIVKTESNRRWQ